MEAQMSDQQFQGDNSPTSTSRNAPAAHNIQDTAGQAFSKASDMARDVGKQAKRAMSDTASNVTDSVKGLLDQQLGSGATMAGHFAKSMRLAADDLDSEAPALGNLVRGFADTVDGYADSVDGRSVEDLAGMASDFTRRQPALVFGLAALAGFFVFRTFKSTQSVAPPLQPTQSGYGAGNSNG
jgi:hypothetical protein